jgi:hypothetical protein
VPADGRGVLKAAVKALEDRLKIVREGVKVREDADAEAP